MHRAGFPLFVVLPIIGLLTSCEHVIEVNVIPEPSDYHKGYIYCTQQPLFVYQNRESGVLQITSQVWAELVAPGQQHVKYRIAPTIADYQRNGSHTYPGYIGILPPGSHVRMLGFFDRQPNIMPLAKPYGVIIESQFSGLVVSLNTVSNSRSEDNRLLTLFPNEIYLQRCPDDLNGK
jgi:hypothetical protein